MMARGIVSAVGLVVAAVGFAAFVALGVGAWYARREADRAAADAAAKAEVAGDFAARVIGLVREAATAAEADLAAARAEAAAAPPDRANPLARMAARQLSVDLDRTRDAVATASEAVVVADAVLDVFSAAGGETGRVGVRAADLDQARAGLDAAARNLRQAQAVVGAATPEQFSAAEAALARGRALADGLDIRLAEVRGRVEVIRDRAVVWALRGAVGVTALAAVGAAGQVFLARACRRGLRGG
jgi:hypothetical protein